MRCERCGKTLTEAEVLAHRASVKACPWAPEDADEHATCFACDARAEAEAEDLQTRMALEAWERRHEDVNEVPENDCVD